VPLNPNYYHPNHTWLPKNKSQRAAVAISQTFTFNALPTNQNNSLLTPMRPVIGVGVGTSHIHDQSLELVVHVAPRLPQPPSNQSWLSCWGLVTPLSGLPLPAADQSSLSCWDYRYWSASLGLDEYQRISSQVTSRTSSTQDQSLREAFTHERHIPVGISGGNTLARNNHSRRSTFQPPQQIMPALNMTPVWQRKYSTYNYLITVRQ
jgi:hypothetical protein